MQMELIFCIGTLYQILTFCGADESDTELASNEDDYVLGGTSTQKSAIIKKELKEYETEKKMGDIADLFGTNQHHSYPDTYNDLGRRFVFQYPYKEISNSNANEDDDDENDFNNYAKNVQDENRSARHLIPVQAPPELVLAVAQRAFLLEAANPYNPSEESYDKEILRSGNYWNNVWREDVDPNILRTLQTSKDNVQPVKVKIMPSSKLYNLVSQLKKISPRLVYVFHKEEKV